MIKKKIGSVNINDDITSTDVTGRDVVTGLPKKVEVTSEDIYNAIKEDVNVIVDSVKFILEKTPPELSSDILATGIYLTGGGALINDLDLLIHDETGLSVNLVEEQKNSVALGIVKVLQDFAKYDDILLTPKKEAKLK